MQIRVQDAVQAAAAAEERRIRADNYRATLLANMQLAEARAARDASDRQAELLRSEAELSATLADPYLGEDPAMAASSLSAYRYCQDSWNPLQSQTGFTAFASSERYLLLSGWLKEPLKQLAPGLTVVPVFDAKVCHPPRTT